MRASVVIITVSDTPLAEKILHHVQALRPDVPVVVRTADERDMERLSHGGAAEVVPETLEASLMLASHALVLVGIPIVGATCVSPSSASAISSWAAAARPRWSPHSPGSSPRRANGRRS